MNSQLTEPSYNCTLYFNPGAGILPKANGEVSLDGVAFSRLD